MLRRQEAGMSRLPSLVTMFALACLVATGCKTTGTPTASQQGGQSAAQPSSKGQQAAQAQAQPMAQSQTQPTAQSPARAAVRLEAPAFAKRAARHISEAPFVNNALSALHRIDLGKMKVRLFGANLPASDLVAPIVAAALLLGGGYWVFASRRLARQGR